MITPTVLDEMLTVLRKHNVMSAQIESDPSGHDKLCVTLGPEFPDDLMHKDSSSDLRMEGDLRLPGGWKTESPSDPLDPDPLGLGTLDAPPAIEDVEETEL